MLHVDIIDLKADMIQSKLSLGKLLFHSKKAVHIKTVGQYILPYM